MLKSPTIKLLLGIVFIALIVVATFAYGRSQRESAIKTSPSVTVEASESASPEAVSEQGNGSGEAGTSATPAATATPAPTASPSAAPAQSAAPAASTVPSSTPAVATADTNKGGEAPATTPETGSGLEYALPITILAVLFAAYRKTVNQNA